MANKTIADFETKAQPANDDLVLLQSNGVTLNTTVRKLRDVVAVTIPSLSSLPVTVDDDAITTNMVAFARTLSNMDAQRSEWTVTTANGSVTVAGNISGTTSLTLYLGRF